MNPDALGVGGRPAPDSAARVAVVMIALNGAERIGRSLEHLTALGERPPIVVVDNGSSDGTVELVRRRFPQVSVVQAGANRGAAARTLGVVRLAVPYVAFAEDDSWYAPGALRRAAEILDAHPEIGLVQAHVLVGPEQRPDPLHDDMVGTPVVEAPELPGLPVLSFLEGTCILRRSAYLTAGGFDPRLFVGGVEEHLAADLLSEGWKLRYVPEVVAYHHPDHGEPTRFVRRLGVRNTLWFAWGRRPPGPALRWTAHVLRQSGPNRHTLEGVAEALRGLPRVLAHRRPLPPAVERNMALLDASKRRSRARRYGSGRPRTA
jgi:GT2 family glycosyltransferase